MRLPRWLSVRESTCQCRRHRRCRFDPWVGQIPWRGKWQPVPVFLPRKFHGQRSLEGYSPWGHKESDTTEGLNNNMYWQHSPLAAAAAKSLQSCLILCDPIDCSPPGFPVPGILQARTLEWVAISFSSAWKWKVKGKSLSHVQLLGDP